MACGAVSCSAVQTQCRLRMQSRVSRVSSVSKAEQSKTGGTCGLLADGEKGTSPYALHVNACQSR